VSPKQFLTGAELQHHACRPVKDSHQYVGHKELINDIVLPPAHHDSKPTGHASVGLHGHGYMPAADDLFHQQTVGKPVKSGLQYSQSVCHHERQQNRIMNHPKPEAYRSPGHERRDWLQRHDSRSLEVYGIVTRGGNHTQNFNPIVRVRFSVVFVCFLCLLCLLFELLYVALIY